MTDYKKPAAGTIECYGTVWPDTPETPEVKRNSAGRTYYTNEDFEDSTEYWKELAALWKGEHAALEAQLKTAVEALKFYAEENNYVCNLSDPNDESVPVYNEDCQGNRARTALAKLGVE